MRETIQNAELKRAKIALLFLPYGAWRERAVLRVRHWSVGVRPPETGLSPVRVSKRPMLGLSAAVTNVDAFHLLDLVLQKWLWVSDCVRAAGRAAEQRASEENQ